eukprot:5345059-Pleurochrysis_carterae.AAC.1
MLEAGESEREGPGEAASSVRSSCARQKSYGMKTASARTKRTHIEPRPRAQIATHARERSNLARSERERSQTPSPRRGEAARQARRAAVS